MRYILISLKESYYPLRKEMQDEVIGLSRFGSLRPVHIKLFEEVPHYVCVCEYRKNICLIICLGKPYLFVINV